MDSIKTGRRIEKLLLNATIRGQPYLEVVSNQFLSIMTTFTRLERETLLSENFPAPESMLFIDRGSGKGELGYFSFNESHEIQLLLTISNMQI